MKANSIILFFLLYDWVSIINILAEIKFKLSSYFALERLKLKGARKKVSRMNSIVHSRNGSNFCISRKSCWWL